MTDAPQQPHRFVILHHRAPDGEHWDLMIERGESLATWRLAQNPCATSGWRCIQAERINDHRKHYLDYEGPLSDNRGWVERVVAGDLQRATESEDCWQISSAAEGFYGTFELTRQDAGWMLRRT